MITLAQLGQLPVAAALADQSDAKRQSIGAYAAGHRDGGVVQQIDKIGVETQVAVKCNRVCLHLGDGVVGRRRGHQQDLNVTPHGSSLLSAELQLCLRLVEISRTVLAAFGDDSAHRLDHLVFMHIKKVPNGRITFGHQRAFIK